MRFKYLKIYETFIKGTYMYHITNSVNVSPILDKGILINQPVYMTKAGVWSHKFYGCNPIFLSKNKFFTKRQSLFIMHLVFWQPALLWTAKANLMGWIYI